MIFLPFSHAEVIRTRRLDLDGNTTDDSVWIVLACFALEFDIRKIARPAESFAEFALNPDADSGFFFALELLVRAVPRSPIKGMSNSSVKDREATTLDVENFCVQRISLENCFLRIQPKQKTEPNMCSVFIGKRCDEPQN